MSRTPAAVPSSIGNRHPSFRGDQPDIPHRRFAEELRIAAQVRPHRPTHPVREELQAGPVIFGKKTAVLADDAVERLRRLLVTPTDLPG